MKISFSDPFKSFIEAYKLELHTKWKIHDVFYISLLEQNTIRKRRVNEKTLPESEKEFEVEDNKKYKLEAIIDNVVSSKEVNNQMPGFYYLILWKGYPKEEST